MRGLEYQRCGLLECEQRGALGQVERGQCLLLRPGLLQDARRSPRQLPNGCTPGQHPEALHKDALSAPLLRREAPRLLRGRRQAHQVQRQGC